VVAGFAKGGARIVASKQSGITKLEQLKGKKVGTARGGAQELLLYAELAKVNLTWSDKGDKDVQILYLAYADINGALLNKSIDAMCQSEPQSSQAIAKGYGAEILKPYDTPMGEPVRALIMTKKLYDEKHADGLEVVEVNWQESAQTAQDFWQSMGLSLPLVLDRSGDVFSQYKLRGLPDSFFVGRDGKIAAMYFGFLNEKRAREKLAAAGLP